VTKNAAVKCVLMFAIVAAVMAAIASASTPKAAVPVKAQKAIAHRAGGAGLAYVPTWVPPKYSYTSWRYLVRGAELDVEFTGSFSCPGWCTDYPALTLTVARSADAGCSFGLTAERTFTFGSRHVRWVGPPMGPTAWFCGGSGKRRLVVSALGAPGPHGPVPRSLARFAASVRQVGR
jgi:hypothetical protein